MLPCAMVGLRPCARNSFWQKARAKNPRFREVMSACLALEQKLRIAYLGPAGTYSHAAVDRHFGGFVEAVPHATIDDVFRAGESGQVDYAVVPVENSTEGAVGRTLDLVCTTHLSICGEIKLRIQQQLLSNCASLADVKRVRLRFGGTVNDVVLASVGAGFRELLISRGEDPDDTVVRSLVPVSTRHEDQRGVTTNRVSMLLYELPVHVAEDPLSAVAEGAGRVLSEIEFLRKVSTNEA